MHLYCINDSSSQRVKSTLPPLVTLRFRPLLSACARVGSSSARKGERSGAIWVNLVGGYRRMDSSAVSRAAAGVRLLGEVEEMSLEEASCPGPFFLSPVFITLIGI